MIALVVFTGFIIDCLLGDPVYRLHPVRLMGYGIAKGEKLLRRGGQGGRIGQEGRGNRDVHDKQGHITAFLTGAVLSLFIIAASFCVSYAILSLLNRLHFVVRLLVEAAFCYQIFAAKALKDESMTVYRQLEKGNIDAARLYLSYIVGRDTHRLDEEGISKAAVETISENLSDGVIAPMLYMFIGGAPLGFAYKAVNTLDSMIGYNNEKYVYFGKFAARLDDAVNFIPSRLAALLMLAAAPLCKMDIRRAWKIFVRDRYKHKSPNSAQTEAVCAGALGVSLSGDNTYNGVLVKKPVIGDPLRPVVKEDIVNVNRLMYTASWLGLIIGVLTRTAINQFLV